MLWADHALLGGRRRSPIRKVAATELQSVDCVMEAPEEWALSSVTEESEVVNASDMATSDALLLGRMTYEALATYWPPQPGKDIGIEGSGASSDCCWPANLSTTSGSWFIPLYWAEGSVSARKEESLRFREKCTEEYTRGRSTGHALSGSRDIPRSNVERVGAEHASITAWERGSDSPYVESIMHGRTWSDDSPTRPAECHWHMVCVERDGEVGVVLVGPWTTAGVAHYAEGAEILWIKFKLGAYMPHLPAGRFLDTESVLPGASSLSFWSQSSIRQLERAKQAAILLRGGIPISDTVHEVGYFDQPHLSRSIKKWIGHTPAQILRSGGPPR